MKIQLKAIPFYFTLFTLFLPILNHLVGMELSTLFICGIFVIAIASLKPNTRYPRYFLFFTALWLIILGLHLFFKKNLAVFGYMQSFFYGFCFYLIYKNLSTRISSDEMYSHLKVIYRVILISLLVELVINLLGQEYLLLQLFSNKESVGLKNYQLLPSRIVMGLTGLDFNSLNSIFFGPQSASMLALMCLLFYNNFEKLSCKGSLFLTLLSLGLLIYANTMTATLIFLVFIFYFIFFSKYSKLNTAINKIFLVTVIIIFFTAILDIFFFVLRDDVLFDLYVLTWFQPFFDLANLDFHSLTFGIPASAKIENLTISWEFGLIQMIYLTGGLPMLFWGVLTIQMVYAIFGFRKFVSKNLDTEIAQYYQISRICLFVLIVSMLSLFHYLAIFSNGFFQFIGIHLAILFYSYDQYRELKVRKFESDFTKDYNHPPLVFRY